MTKKLALVIAGAVSLGSYEAGVIFEVLEAIAINNKGLDENNPNRIEIDIITGASAGGMTACLLAQNLLYNGESLTDPYNNPIYKAWVKEVDIIKLLDFKSNRKGQKESLLNIKVVEDIADNHLLNDKALKIKSDNNNGELPKHLAVSTEIQVGVAMSNLSGFSYKIKTQTQENFEYIRHKDQFIFSVKKIGAGAESVLNEKQLGEDNLWHDSKPNNDNKPITWSDIRNAGISSGAFPLAFPLRRITRFNRGGKFAERNSIKKREDNPKSKYNGDFLYTDGGVFENEPVGMAKALARGSGVDDNSRFYLLVKPGPRKTIKDPFLEKYQNIFANVIALFGAILQQVQFQDFIMEDINSLLLTITSKDNELIGDVFSAFSGFLDERFRHYDYEIGRQEARKQLLLTTRKEMPRKEGLLMDLPEKDLIKKYEDNPIVIKNRETLGILAKEIIDEESGTRNQLKEFHRLMASIEKKDREIMCEHIRDRLDSLVNFVNEQYLNPLLGKKNKPFFLKFVFRFQGLPITNYVLKKLVLNPWLKKHVLEPEQDW